MTRRETRMTARAPTRSGGPDPSPGEATVDARAEPVDMFDGVDDGAGGPDDADGTHPHSSGDSDDEMPEYWLG
jgi:hypothetical protein